MSEATWAVVIVALIGPVVLAVLNGWQRHREERRRYAREDAVAARAAEVAERLLANNELVAERTGEALATIHTIHTLVNSGLTATKVAQLNETRRALVLMRELVGLHRADGREPAPETVVEIDVQSRKVAELEAELAERAGQARRVGQQND